ncbi:hypothetical protein U3C68_003941 [Cronobacter sakazakii]|nr:hypothetical protein [Cronobacter sakazakii]
MTFTKEQLIAAAHGRIDFANMMLSDNPEPLKERTWSIELELARIALSALRERAEPVAGNAAEFGDAYQGAREDLQIWKRRALEAEGTARRLAEINDYLVLQAQGECHFGEPVVREPGALLHCAEQLHSGGTALYTAPPAPAVPEGLRIALSNAGIAAPESDEMLWASRQHYIQMLVTWVKDRQPFKPAPVVTEPVSQSYKLP